MIPMILLTFTKGSLQLYNANLIRVIVTINEDIFGLRITITDNSFQSHHYNKYQTEVVCLSPLRRISDRGGLIISVGKG